MRSHRVYKAQTLMRTVRGFTLTEMLVTLLIMTLASTLLATGVPVAVDTYHKTVNSSNAQLALSTTATVLRSELGLSTDVKISADESQVEYLDAKGFWASIQNTSDSKTHRGLEKQYYKDRDCTKKDGSPYQLITDASITDALTVSFESVSKSANRVSFKNLVVRDAQGNALASIESYEVLTRFSS